MRLPRLLEQRSALPCVVYVRAEGAENGVFLATMDIPASTVRAALGQPGPGR